MLASPVLPVGGDGCSALGSGASHDRQIDGGSLGTIRSGPRGYARRLVLASGRAAAHPAKARGVLAYAHRPGRPTAGPVAGRKRGHACHRQSLDLLWFEDLRAVHLVLHSYAGVLAGPVAEQAAGRLASLTYLAAFVAEPGESLLDVEPPETAERYRSLATQARQRPRHPGLAAVPGPVGHHRSGPAGRRWVPRLTDFPFRCATDDGAVRSGGAGTGCRRSTSTTRGRRWRAFAGRWTARWRRGWPMHELPYGHDLMLAAPGPTADLLTGDRRAS